MEKQGLLQLETGKGREKHIHLTAAGQQKSDACVQPIYIAEQQAFSEMTEPEREQLVALTDKFIRLLQNMEQNICRKHPRRNNNANTNF